MIRRRTFLKAAGVTLASLLGARHGARPADADSGSGGLLRKAILPQLAADGTGSHSEDWRITGIERPALAVFDAAMKDFMAERNIPNGALAIVDRRRLVFARGYSQGPA